MKKPKLKNRQGPYIVGYVTLKDIAEFDMMFHIHDHSDIEYVPKPYVTKVTKKSLDKTENTSILERHKIDV